MEISLRMNRCLTNRLRISLSRTPVNPIIIRSFSCTSCSIFNSCDIFVYIDPTSRVNRPIYRSTFIVYKSTKRKNILPSYHQVSPYEYTIDRISTGNGSCFTFCRKFFNHFPAFSMQSSWPTLQAAFNINTRNSLETNGNKTRFS